MGGGKRILFVCTGNTCRSPMAAAFLHHLLKEGQEGDNIIIESAGLAAWPGAPAAEHAVRVLAEEGIDLSAHRARQVTAEMVAAATLVLTMTREQKEAVLRLAPQAQGKVFTLKEMGAPPEVLAEWAQIEKLRAELQKREDEFLQEHGHEIRDLQQRRGKLVEELAEVEAHLQDWEAKMKAATAAERRQLQKREMALPPPDISDPFGQTEEEYRLCAREIRRCLERIAAKLQGGDD